MPSWPSSKRWCRTIPSAGQGRHHAWSRSYSSRIVESDRIFYKDLTCLGRHLPNGTEKDRTGPRAMRRKSGLRWMRSSAARGRRAAGVPSGREGATEGAVRPGSRPRVAASISRRFLMCSQQFWRRRSVGVEGIG
jgi:hypothetical protein